MIDIFKEVFAGIKEAVDDWAEDNSLEVIVVNEYQEQVSHFPYITVAELSNVETDRQREFGQAETFTTLAYNINIYDNSANKIKNCRNLAIVISDYLQSIGFKRAYNEAVANIADAQVYRIVQRYDGYMNNNTNIIYKSL